MRLFIAVMVFLELVHFIAQVICLMEGEYPRLHRISRTIDIAAAFLAATIAYWGLCLLSP
jgi:hypothetical protein